MEYRCIATSLEGFIQQLAVAYIARGYFYYVMGTIPAGKDLAAIDEKLITRYGITAKKWERARRKQAGVANMQYIRFEQTFVLLATAGRHIFKDRERDSISDVRRNAIHFGGYQISHRNGHLQVRMTPETYRQLKAHYVDLACRRSKENLAVEFYRAPFEPYAGIRREMFNILREVNRQRKTAGYERLPASCIWLKRRIVKPFESMIED